MGILDYYVCLGLKRCASNTDIKKAYRKLALKYHPTKNHDPDAEEKFEQLAEAYDVLSNDKLRAVYDQFGEEGLTRGVPLISDDDGTSFTMGYTFHGDSRKVFSDFFGGCNPFSDYFTGIVPDAVTGAGGLHGRHAACKQDPPVHRELALSLEECFHGCTKKMKIARRVMNGDGHTSSIREKILTIHVRPGWEAGTAINFSKEGDQGPNSIPADIVFETVDKPHPRFRRVGRDLIYTAQVSLGESLTGCSVEVLTLDDRTLRIPINDIVQPGYTKRVPGEGMPTTCKQVGSKGQLIIEFNINFPTRLSQEQKQLLRKALIQ
ncbi:PREDICTED: dnaJ homolog subfamily B member 13-like [Priapulus caudatus]|uniref:DnaJ homolog subfamily B member 13-like n=1 Tax=Priapulus caudatus TaxID=37621 RepID=A0ABM1F363_PRICU|nr:PREDICTED: dnaJ homolog subfamily B member 13-like [Priapulus caudatus]